MVVNLGGGLGGGFGGVFGGDFCRYLWVVGLAAD